jgi:hypothetical protein
MKKPALCGRWHKQKPSTYFRMGQCLKKSFDVKKAHLKINLCALKE